MKRAVTQSRGWTLVETLVTLAVIAVLIGVAAPVLMHARRAALGTRYNAELRDGVVLLTAAAGERGGAFPRMEIAEPPGVGTSPVVFAGELLDHPYFRANGTYWPSLIGDSRFLTAPELNEQRGGRIEPYARSTLPGTPSGVVATLLQCTHTAFADPAFFRSDASADRSNLRAVRIDEAVYASAKGLIRDVRPLPARRGEGDPADMWRFATLDAAVRSVHRTELLPAARNSTLLGEEPIPIMATQDGIRGRDL